MDAADLTRTGVDEITGEAARAQRIDLLQQLLHEGFTLEQLKKATNTGRLALLPIDRVLHRDNACYTRLDLAQLGDLPVDFLSRLWRVLGLDDLGDEAIAFAEPDLQAVRLLAGYRAAGLDEDTLCRISQVLGLGCRASAKRSSRSSGRRCYKPETASRRSDCATPRPPSTSSPRSRP